jgi:hypothetical protein
MTLAPELDMVMPGPADRLIDPTLVDVPAPSAETTVPDAAVVFPLIANTPAPLLEIVIPGPADSVIVPVDEPPGAEMTLPAPPAAAMDMTEPVVIEMFAPAENDGPAIVID